MIRRQLAAYSPLRAWELAQAGARSVFVPASARDALRSHLGERFPADRIVLTGSGTQALQLALACVGAKAAPHGVDRLVAIPSYSCFDIATAVVGADVSVVAYDVDPTSLSPDIESLERALTSGATAVLAGNLYGYPIDWGSIRARCRDAGALLIEDAAQGLGSLWRDKPGGTFGDLTVLSFGRGKGWTGGGGGALLVRSGERLVPPARAGGLGSEARAAAVAFAQWGVGRPGLYGIPAMIPRLGLGETRYHEPGPIVDMSAFGAAAVLGHSRVALAEIEVRRGQAAVWNDALDQGAGVRIVPIPGGQSSFLRFPLLMSDAVQAADVAARLGRHGVARGYPQPLHALQVLRRRFRVPPTDLAGGEELAERLLSVPTHSLVTDHERRAVVAELERLAR